jgi:CheY-like chemotaxis protein
MGVSGRPIVVVIDDDPSMRALVRLHLANGGCDVFEAGDGIAGRYLVMTAAPDLVICDVHMPRMTGLELLADLKADPLTRDVPVVLLTGDDDIATLAKAVGAADCLRKPVAGKRLLEMAGAFVGGLT